MPEPLRNWSWNAAIGYKKVFLVVDHRRTFPAWLQKHQLALSGTTGRDSG